VPTNVTSCPLDLNSRATAISGSTCPPVPPPAITNLAIAHAGLTARWLTLSSIPSMIIVLNSEVPP